MSNHLHNGDSKVVYVTLESGKTYRLEQFDSLYRHRRHLDEVRQRYTRRGSWYRTHVESRDVPDSKAARADLSDNGRMVGYMVAALDGKFLPSGIKPIIIPTFWGLQLGDKWYYRCVVAKSNCRFIARKLKLEDWRYVGRFVVALWKNGDYDKEKTMEDFEIQKTTYYDRIDKYLEICTSRTGVDMC